MGILLSTMNSGARNCQGQIYPGVCSARTLPREGLFENELHIGDRLQIGSARIMVRQPRIPCYKLALKFRRNDILARFLRSGRSGFYFSVEQEGIVEAGDSFEWIGRAPHAISIAEMNRLFSEDRYNAELLERAIATPDLPEDWRVYFRKRISGSPIEAVEP